MTEGGKWHCWRRRHTNWKSEFTEYQGQGQNKKFRVRRTCQGRKKEIEPNAHTSTWWRLWSIIIQYVEETEPQRDQIYAFQTGIYEEVTGFMKMTEWVACNFLGHEFHLHQFTLCWMGLNSLRGKFLHYLCFDYSNFDAYSSPVEPTSSCKYEIIAIQCAYSTLYFTWRGQWRWKSGLGVVTITWWAL